MMITMLDLLAVVGFGLIAAGVLVLGAMFLVPSDRVRRVCLYIAAGLGVYLGYVGLRVNAPGFPVQCALAVALALAGVGAVVLEKHLHKAQSWKYLPRMTAAVSVLGGLMNAFVW